jgi:glycine/D-amino acid oxidase-like deaminating enzyme
LLQEAKAHGVELCTGRVRRVQARGGCIAGVTIDTADGLTREVATAAFVNAAGPYARAVGEMAGMSLPLFSEAHYKVALDDVAGAVPRGTGLVILDDPQDLEFSDDERAELAADPHTQRLTGKMPAGVHLRPEGYGDSRTVLLLWDYHSDERYDAPVYPMPVDPFYPEVALRGMTKLVPALAAYLDRVPAVAVDGGYYTKTLENRPLIGAAGHTGAFACCGFSGYGLMAAPAAAELVAAQVCGAPRAPYAAAFLPSRFDEPAYLARLATWGSTGQL